MRVRGDLSPPERFAIEEQPRNPNLAQVRFFENVKPFSEEIDGIISKGYEYDEYVLSFLRFDATKENIENNFENFLNQAKAQAGIDISIDPKTLKLLEVGKACTLAIHEGVEVEGHHYSLENYDQHELLGLVDQIKDGAVAVPYHANGELCQIIPADKFMLIADAATAHIFYHRTYCNHLNYWIRRTETREELNAIFYGVELPKDLAENMTKLLEAMQK